MIHVSVLRFHRHRGVERSKPICDRNGHLRTATAQFELFNAVILSGVGVGGGLGSGLGSGQGSLFWVFLYREFHICVENF